MTNKKRSFISMLAGNKKKCCCDMEIVPEDKDTKQRLKKQDAVIWKLLRKI